MNTDYFTRTPFFKPTFKISHYTEQQQKLSTISRKHFISNQHSKYHTIQNNNKKYFSNNTTQN